MSHSSDKPDRSSPQAAPYSRNGNGYHSSNPVTPQSGEPIEYVNLPLTSPEGEVVKVRVPLDQLLPAMAAVETIQPAELDGLIRFLVELPLMIELPDPYGNLMFKVPEEHLIFLLKASVEAGNRLLAPLQEQSRSILPEDIDGDNASQSTQKQREKALIKLSYKLLQDRAWTRTKAAQYAGHQLQREINPDVWQQRVDRWAKKWGLPKIVLRRRQPH